MTAEDLAMKLIDYTSGANPLLVRQQGQECDAQPFASNSEISTEGLNHLKSYIAKKKELMRLLSYLDADQQLS